MWANWQTFGASSESVTGEQAWPQFGGNYDTFLAWEMHGIRLSPRLAADPFEDLATVQAVREGCDGNPRRYKGVGYFQLAPDVALVPVRVVVFYPDDGSVSPDWVSEKDARLLLDDVWSGPRTRTASDDCFVEDINGAWSHRAGCEGQPGCETVVQASTSSATTGMVQPDRIWDQCGVQFRMVSYHQCEIPRSLFNPLEDPEDGLCGAVDSRMRTLRNTLAPGCGIPFDPTAEVQLMFTGRLEPLSCTQGSNQQNTVYGIHDGGAVAVTRLGVEQRGLVPAHEIGHALGLNDLMSCADDNLLMCFAVPEQGTNISDDDCDTAHARALTIQQNFWNVP